MGRCHLRDYEIPAPGLPPPGVQRASAKHHSFAATKTLARHSPSHKVQTMHHLMRRCRLCLRRN